VLATGEPLSDVAVVRSASGALAFRFTRPLAGAASSPARNASTTLHPFAGGATPFVWAHFPSWSVATTLEHPVHDDMHTAWSRAATLIDLRRGTSQVAAGAVERAIVAHAVLMALAWGVVFPAAAAAARHLKPLGGASFFYAHVGLNAVGFILLCAGFGTIYSHVAQDGGSEARHFTGSSHVRLGLAVFILSFFQPLGGMLRPAAPRDGEKPARARRLWELGHKACGRLLLCLGLLAVATGVGIVAHHGGSVVGARAGMALWLLWCVLGLAGGGVALEMQRKRREGGAGGAPGAGGSAWARLGA
jgi:hypothetical protein